MMIMIMRRKGTDVMLMMVIRRMRRWYWNLKSMNDSLKNPQDPLVH